MDVLRNVKKLMNPVYRQVIPGYSLSLLVALWAGSVDTGSDLAPPTESTAQKSRSFGLELLFEAESSADGEVKPYVVSDNPFSFGFSMQRDLIAQGKGTFQGPRIRGTLTWSKLARKFREHEYSNTWVTGWLETEDGAEIMYEAKGYAVIPDMTQPGNWMYTATVRFEEPDEPYEWMSNVVAVWVGDFNVETGKAHYRAYIPSELD